MANFIGKWCQDLALGEMELFPGCEWESNEPKCHRTSASFVQNFAEKTLMIIPTQSERYRWFDSSNLRNVVVWWQWRRLVIVVVVVSLKTIFANSKSIVLQPPGATQTFEVNIIPTPSSIYDKKRTKAKWHVPRVQSERARETPMQRKQEVETPSKATQQVQSEQLWWNFKKLPTSHRAKQIFTWTQSLLRGQGQKNDSVLVSIAARWHTICASVQHR